MKYKFATAINCIDGRTQEPVIDFVRRKFSVDYVDMITEPGPDKILSENKKSGITKSIKDNVLISTDKHKSRVIVIVGHHDCAADPVEKEEHYRQIKEAVQNIKEWNLDVDVYGVWVDKNWEAVLL